MSFSWLICAPLARRAVLPLALGAIGVTGCSHHHRDYHDRERVVVLRNDHPRRGYYDADGCWHDYARNDDRRDHDRHRRDDDRYRRWDGRRDGRWD
jgi:hypothetical protein